MKNNEKKKQKKTKQKIAYLKAQNVSESSV